VKSLKSISVCTHNFAYSIRENGEFSFPSEAITSPFHIISTSSVDLLFSAAIAGLNDDIIIIECCPFHDDNGNRRTVLIDAVLGYVVHIKILATHCRVFEKLMNDKHE
jgi:hypothetical protein